MRIRGAGSAWLLLLAAGLGCSGDDRGTKSAVAGNGAAGQPPSSTGGSHPGTATAGSGGGGGNGESDAAGGAGGSLSIVDSGDARLLADAKTDGDRADSAVAYNPCPPKGTRCVIMPVGDSITAGYPTPETGGYRVPLFHLAHAALQSITFVGSLASGPDMVDGVPFPRSHEGHSGFIIDTDLDASQIRNGISQFFPERITTYKPHIILLMIGTNDVNTGQTMIPARLANLMDTMLAADPKLLLVVAQIVPQQKANPDTFNISIREFNAAIPGLVKARADAGKHVTMVDMYGAFTSNPNYSTAYLADRLHPNPAGYAVMADTWYRAIGSLLR